MHYYLLNNVFKSPSFWLSVSAIIISIIALVPCWIAYNKTKFRMHLTCEKYEENEELFASFTFINSSLEPYSVLRLDYIMGNAIQFISLSELLHYGQTTLVPPRDIIRLKGIKLAFTKQDVSFIKSNSNSIHCVKVYTTKRNKPYCIHLKSGPDDSVKFVCPAPNTA